MMLGPLGFDKAILPVELTVLSEDRLALAIRNELCTTLEIQIVNCTRSGVRYKN
jgi:hypothetical protein